MVGALAAAALLIPSSTFGALSHSLDGAVEDYDSRTATIAPTIAQQLAAESLGATVRWNRFGTPQSLVNHGGFLARGVAGEDAESAARAWLQENAGLFRLGQSTELALHNVAPLAGSDAFVVTLRQRVGGLLLAPDGLVTIGLVQDGEGWNIAYVSSSLTGAGALDATRELSPVEAMAAATEDVDAPVEEEEIARDGSKAGWMQFEIEGFEEPQYVRRVAFPTPHRGVISAYETVYADGHSEGYAHIVDAETGDILHRQSIVDHAIDNPKWLVFPAYPQLTTLNRYPWNYPSSDIRDLWCWEFDPGCKLVVANPAARVQWDTEPRTQTPTFTTVGNAAESAEGWFGGGASGYRPTSPTRDYIYPWTNQWFEEECNPAVFETPQRNDIDAATANLFAMHWKLHDWQYHLGFTEATWNAQDFNFGINPAGENDPLEGRVQSGAIVPKSRDNANMATRPDGQSSITNMFLWQPLAGGFYAPCVDGDYDQSVIGHEYGHMTENRMIGKGNRRQGFHAGAMGESFGDLNGMEYLNEYNYVPVGGESPYAVGAYVTGNSYQGIRNYNMSYRSGGKFPEERVPAYPSERYVNPLNFSAVGYDIVGPQVHADGEMWSATNFDIREILLDRYQERGFRHQFECAEGERPAQDCPGNRRWFQLYFDAMLLMPVAPSFLDARDAILAADVLRFGGANQDIIWLAFARRGFGENATTTGPQDTEPRGNWESPLSGEATLTFTAVAKDEGNAPIEDFQVYQGDYEARVTPLNRVERFVPDDAKLFEAYNFVAHAPGYGHVRFYVKGLEPGEERNIVIHFPTNWASQAKGATAAGDGENHERLIDDTESTNWQSIGPPAQGRQVVIQLAGPRTFSYGKASALLVPGQNRFTALRQFELYACTADADPANPTCAGDNEAGWQRIYRSHKDAFPAVNPRPTSPELQLRSFNPARTTATHVRFVVLENQCTGQPSFQGEQDQDPTNPTDCRDTSVDEQVRAAELQLLSSQPRVDGAQDED